MSNTIMKLLVGLGIDSKEFDEGIDKAHGKAGGFGKAMGGIGMAVGAIGAAAGVAMTAAAGALASTIGPASDLNETISKVGVVFGDWAEDVVHFGDSAATALGMSSNEAMAAAGTYGNLFRAMGIGVENSADMSMSLVTLASDLASFNNSDPATVLDALRSGLSGETEPLKKLGVNLNAAMLEAKALEMGLWDGEGALDAAAKAQATYALVMEQTTLAQGDFARTADGLANQQRTMKANFEDIKATIGTGLLPVVASLTGGFNELLGGIKGIIAGSGTMDEKMAGIGDLVAGFVNGIATQLPSIIQAGATMVISLVEGVVKMLPAMMPAVVQLMLTLVDGIITLIPILLEAGLQIIVALALGIAQALPTLIPSIIQMLLTIITVLVENIPLLLEAGIQIILGLITGIIDALPLIIEQLPVIVMKIVEVIIQSLPLLMNAAVQIILALVQGIAMNLPALVAMIITLVVEIVNTIIQNLPMLLDAGKKAVTGLINGIKAMIPEVVEVAKNVMTGLWNGLKSKFEEIWQGIKDFGIEMLDLLKGIFEIGSPSRVMFDLGKNMMLGLANGLEKYEVQPGNVMINAGNKLAAAPAAQGAQAGAGSWMAIDWHMVGRVFAEELARISRR